MRTILAKIICTGATGCCGGRNKPAVKYSILSIDRIDSTYSILEFTRPMGNYMAMMTKYIKAHPDTKRKAAYKGTVYGMALHKDEAFMAQLRAKVMKSLKGKCEIAHD